ncbi:MAG: polysaccharide biosynthesis C-terminal domain-containing protein, partial [Pseudomonadota bacterium]
ARDGTQETALALGACRAVFALAGPVLVAAAVLAPEIVPMLLGAGWGPVVPLLSLLAAAQLFALLGAALPAIAIRVDRVDVLARLEILILCLRLPLLWFAMSEFGIIGAGYASLAVSLVTLVLSVRLLGRLLGTGPGAVARALLGPFLGLAAMTLALDAGRSAWLVGLDPLGLLIAVVVLTALAGLVHLAVMALAWQFSGRPPGLERFCIEAAARRTRRAIGLQGSGV